MALKDLSIDQIDELMESHEFPYEYDCQVYNRETRQFETVHRVGADQGWSSISEAIEYGGNTLEIAGLGTVSHIESFGGEGQGDQYWMVFKITDGDVSRTFKRDGWYASYDGGYLEGPTTEVKAVQKTITVWE